MTEYVGKKDQIRRLPNHILDTEPRNFTYKAIWLKQNSKFIDFLTNFLNERSEAYSSVTSLCVSSFKCNFLGTYWSDLSDFCINSTTGSRSIIFQVFGGQIFFRRVSGKNEFSDFSEGKGYTGKGRVLSLQ